MAENEIKKELNEAEEEGVTGGRRIAPFRDGPRVDLASAPAPRPEFAKAPMPGFAPETKETAKKDDVIRPLPFPQDRR